MDPLQSLDNAVTAAPTPAARVRALNALSTELARTATRAAGLRDRAGGARPRGAQRRPPARRRDAACARALPFLPRRFHARARMHAARPRSIYQDAGDLAGAATAFAGIGMCQHRLGAHDDAVASLLRALELARTQKLDTLEINIYNSLGSALIAADRVDEAARYLDTGIELAQARDNRNLLTKLLLNQSLLAKPRGDDARAADASRGAQRSTRRASRRRRRRWSSRARSATPTTRRTAWARPAPCCGSCTATPTPTSSCSRRSRSAARSTSPTCRPRRCWSWARCCVAEGRTDRGAASACPRRSCSPGASAARSVLAEACEALSQVHEQAGDFAAALAHVQGVPRGARRPSSPARASTRRPPRSSGSTSRMRRAARRSTASAPKRLPPTTRRWRARRRC